MLHATSPKKENSKATNKRYIKLENCKFARTKRTAIE